MIRSLCFLVFSLFAFHSSQSFALIALIPEQRFSFADALANISVVASQFECGVAFVCNDSGFIVEANVHSLQGALPADPTVWAPVAMSLTRLTLVGLAPLDSAINEIPHQVALLTNLVALSISRVGGASIPTSLAQLTNLQSLSILNSAVSGSIPPPLINNLLQLRSLVLDAPLTGQFPAAIFDRSFDSCALAEMTPRACFLDLVCPPSCRCQASSLGCGRSTETLAPLTPADLVDTPSDDELTYGVWIGIAAGILGVICIAAGFVVLAATRREDAAEKAAMLPAASSSASSSSNRSYPTPTSTSTMVTSTTNDSAPVELTKRPSRRRSSRRKVQESVAASTSSSVAPAPYGAVPDNIAPVQRRVSKRRSKQTLRREEAAESKTDQNYVAFDSMKSDGGSVPSEYNNLSLGPVYHAPPGVSARSAEYVAPPNAPNARK